jgi:hypothetical protein
MDYYDHSEAKSWRARLAEFLTSRGGLVMSPLDKPSNDPDIAETEEDKSKLAGLKAAGNFDEVQRIMKKVCQMDLKMVDRSDFVVAQVDVSAHMCGTYDEIFFNELLRHPTLIFVEGGKGNAPNWLYGRVKHQNIFGSLDELIEHLKWIDQTPVSEIRKVNKRWFFFDHSKPC